MIDFLAGIFGYVLNFIYDIVKNYGLAIILFSVLLKIIMLPLTIKQQKTMKKNMKIQEKSKEIQAKYRGNKEKISPEIQEKMNKEIMDLYKSENTSPFSGCLTSIVQIVLLFSIFYLVRCPLTHMIKMEPETIEKYTNEIQAEATENGQKISYPEISLIKLAKQKMADEETSEEEKAIYEKMAINMDFIGLDLSNVPTQDMSNPTVFVIPVLYVISTFVSIKLTSNMSNNKKKEKEDSKLEEQDPMAGASKGMLWFMPIMSISIAIIAPLGLALYWLVNNLLMIVERLIIDKFIVKPENENE